MPEGIDTAPSLPPNHDAGLQIAPSHIDTTPNTDLVPQIEITVAKEQLQRGPKYLFAHEIGATPLTNHDVSKESTTGDDVLLELQELVPQLERKTGILLNATNYGEIIDKLTQQGNTDLINQLEDAIRRRFGFTEPIPNHDLKSAIRTWQIDRSHKRENTQTNGLISRDQVENPTIEALVQNTNGFIGQLMSELVGQNPDLPPIDIVDLVTNPSYLSAAQRDSLENYLSYLFKELNMPKTTDLVEMAKLYKRLGSEIYKIRGDIQRENEQRTLGRVATYEQERQEQKSKLNETVGTAKRGMEVLIAYAVDHGIEPTAFVPVSEVYDTSGFEPAIGGGSEVENLTGKALIGQYDLEEIHVVLHESFHRAAILKANDQHPADESAILLGRFLPLEREIAKLYGIPISNVGATIHAHAEKYSSLDESELNNQLNQDLRKLLSASFKINEGLTEWSTQLANELVKDQTGEYLDPQLKPNEDIRYKEYVVMVSKIKDLLQTQGKSEAEAQAYLIFCALTGDISQLATSLGGAEVLTNLIDSTPYAISHPAEYK